ncbi:unnamed protein product [Closterium sp. NIES-54]
MLPYFLVFLFPACQHVVGARCLFHVDWPTAFLLSPSPPFPSASLSPLFLSRLKTRLLPRGLAHCLSSLPFPSPPLGFSFPSSLPPSHSVSCPQAHQCGGRQGCLFHVERPNALLFSIRPSFVLNPLPLQSLALEHANVVGGKVVFSTWTETDFRTGEEPWWMED